MFFVNERLHVLPEKIRDADEFSGLPPEQRLEVRDAFLDEMDVIEKFIDENPAGFAADELEIVHSWHELVAGEFFIFRYLKKYTVFLSSEEHPVAYGVLALTQPLEGLVGPYLPVMTKAVLLPFKDRIVYDGLLSSYSISFGGGIRRGLSETYQSAKQRLGIVTALPITQAHASTVKASKPRKHRAPAQPFDDVHGVLGQIVGMTDQFCREHLNDEYAILCRKLAEKLARKRPSPLLSGNPNTWASGIVRTIGFVNFLDVRSQKPHMKMTAIDKAFGIGESTGQGKSKAIRNLLKIHRFDHEWTLPSRMDENPLIWMLEVNGFIQDIRHCPREAQEIAFAKGLIPYIPADRGNRE
jgi:hypothetical protein